MMNRKKWSVMIIVLFLLFVWALFVLLIYNYLFNFLTNFSEIRKYYKAYWLANAGIEIEKVKINKHLYWFEDRIISDSDTNKNNWNCKNCFFDTKLISRTMVYSNLDNIFDLNSCDDDTYFTLWTGNAIVFPLYWESVDWNNENNVENIASIEWYNNKITVYNSWGLNYEFLIWEIDKNLNKKVIKKSVNNWSIDYFVDNSFDTERFFALVNISNDKLGFCLEFQDRLPVWVYKIISNWKFMDRSVWLELKIYSKIPDFFVYNIVTNN